MSFTFDADFFLSFNGTKIMQHKCFWGDKMCFAEIQQMMI